MEERLINLHLMNSKSYKPLVSIVIPVYNGSNYLSESIDSALKQTYENFEVIVVNDGSNDHGKTRDIALSYGDKIRFFEKENGGVSSALNLGISEMRGEYFSWLSHDDLYSPHKIKVQIDRLCSEKSSIQIVYSDSFSFRGQEIQTKRLCRIKKPFNKSTRYMIAFDNSLHGCSLLIPKAAFDACGVFNESLKYCQDYDMWFRLAKKFSFIHIPEPLVYGRIHTAQTGNQSTLSAHKEVDILRTSFFKELIPSDFGSKGEAISIYLLIAPIRFSTRLGYQRLCNELIINGSQFRIIKRVISFILICYYESRSNLIKLFRFLHNRDNY